MTAVDEKEIRKLFDRIAEKSSGKVTRDGLKDFLLTIYPGQNLFADTFLSEISSDGIDYDNFLKLICEGIVSSDSQNEFSNIDEVFRVLDRNGDGLLEKDDITYVLKRLGLWKGPGHAEKMFNEADHDSDGFITLEEFRNILKK